MRKSKTLCLIVMTMVSMSATAQLTVDDSKTNVDLNLVENCVELSAGYLRAVGSHEISGFGKKDVGLNGAILSMDMLFNVTKQKCLPLFVTAGFDIGFALGDFSLEKSYFVSSFAFNLHPGITYKFKVAKNFTIAPVVEIGLKFNCVADASKKKADTIKFLTTKESDTTIPYSSQKAAKIFQPEGIFGLTLCIKNFLIGYKYHLDMIPFYDYNGAKISIGYHAVTVGIRLKG